MIYDCFTFFNELDLLEIRLNTLNDVVDRFVIAEKYLRSSVITDLISYIMQQRISTFH